MFRVSDERRDGVIRCAEHLHETKIGEIISHRELRRTLGTDLGDQYYQIMLAARAKLNKEHGIVFVAARGVGYKRLGATEGVVATGAIGLSKVRKTTKRYGLQLEHAMHHANDLSADDRRRANQTLSGLGLMNYLARKQTVAKIPIDAATEKTDTFSGLKRIFGL
jgi:hypothetical protein